MLSPLWESHSRQAATHERQPMQREGSRKIRLTVSSMRCLLSQYWIWSGMSHGQFTAAFLGGDEGAYVFAFCPFWRLFYTSGRAGADFVFWYLHHRLKYRVGELVGGLGVSVVIGNEQGVGADGAHD